MPHIAIEHFPAQITSVQKAALSTEITTLICQALHCKPDVVSITMETVEPNDWPDIYRKKITNKQTFLIKTPNYQP